MDISDGWFMMYEVVQNRRQAISVNIVSYGSYWGVELRLKIRQANVSRGMTVSLGLVSLESEKYYNAESNTFLRVLRD